MVIIQLASEVSIIPEWDTLYTKNNNNLKGLSVAVVAAESSVDTVWLIKIASDSDMANDLIRDSYGLCILAGQDYFKGHFSEKDNMVKNGYIYKVKKKDLTLFFKESILYLFVRFYDTPKGLLLKYEDFVDILMYAQSKGITTAL